MPRARFEWPDDTARFVRADIAPETLRRLTWLAWVQRPGVYLNTQPWGPVQISDEFDHDDLEDFIADLRAGGEAFLQETREHPALYFNFDHEGYLVVEGPPLSPRQRADRLVDSLFSPLHKIGSRSGLSIPTITGNGKAPFE